jgi:predicted TIM-barrel fold metal-dependent hydrolase
VEAYLETLDANRVSYGVIAAASLFGSYNDYTIAALRRYPRLRGTVIVEPNIGFYELEGMKRDGVVGIRLQLFNVQPLPDFQDDAYVRLFHRLRGLGMHVHVNVEGTRLPALIDVLAPTGVKIVIDHFGWPDDEYGLECPAFLAAVRACQRGQAWVKLSAGYRRLSLDLTRQYAQAYVERVGIERLFWGSDAPFVGHEGTITYRDTIQQFSDWLPDGSVRDAICRNAHDFYFGG